jgi:tryptophan synthase beta subunit
MAEARRFVSLDIARNSLIQLSINRNHTGSHKINNAIGQVKHFLQYLIQGLR